jgi:hypothetical protein
MGSIIIIVSVILYAVYIYSCVTYREVFQARLELMKDEDLWFDTNDQGDIHPVSRKSHQEFCMNNLLHEMTLTRLRRFELDCGTIVMLFRANEENAMTRMILSNIEKGFFYDLTGTVPDLEPLIHVYTKQMPIQNQNNLMYSMPYIVFDPSVLKDHQGKTVTLDSCAQLSDGVKS